MLFFIGGCIILGVATEVLKSKYSKVYKITDELIKDNKGNLYVKHIGRIE